MGFTRLLERREGGGGGGGGGGRSEGSSGTTRRGSELDSQLAAGDYDDDDYNDDDVDDASLYSANSEMGGGGGGRGGGHHNNTKSNSTEEKVEEEDRDWPCGPESYPEPWREGVPPEIQHIVEDAFATLASRVRALLNEVHYHSVDEAVRGRPFVPTGTVSGAKKEGGRIRAWRQLAQVDDPQGFPPIFISLMDAPVTVSQMDETIADPKARPLWDPFCLSGKVPPGPPWGGGMRGKIGGFV